MADIGLVMFWTSRHSLGRLFFNQKQQAPTSPVNSLAIQAFYDPFVACIAPSF